MEEEVKSGCESQDADDKAVQPEDPEQPRPPPPRRSPRSVLRVSQLLLRAISGHRPLTLTDLKKELGSAGYEVRRKIARRSGTPARPEATGTLLRVSGRDASGYFRVWKIPKSKRKSRRSRARETSCCSRGCPLRSRSPRPVRPRSRRKAAKKARECWRRKVRSLSVQTRRVRVRARAKDRQARARARKEARAQVMDEDRASLSSEDTSPSSCDERRPSSKLRDESAVLAKRTTRRPTCVRADRAPSGPAKMRIKCSTAPKGPGNSSRNP